MADGIAFPPRLTAHVCVQLQEAVGALAWSEAGSVLAAASLAGEVVVFDHGGRRLAAFDVRAPVVVLRWSPGGAVLAIGAEDGSVVLWREGMPRLHVSAGSTVHDLAWCDDSRLAVGAGDRLAVLSPLGVLVDHCAVPAGAATVLASDGTPTSSLVVGGVGGVAEHSLPLSDRPATRWQGAAVAALAVQRGSGVIAAGTMGGDVDLLFLADGERTTVVAGSGPVGALGWSADSRALAVVADGALRVWNVDPFRAQAQPLGSLRAHDDWVLAAVFSPHGSLLASVGLDGRLVLWDPAQTPDPLERITLSGELAIVAWDWDGRHLAVGGSNGDVVVVDCTPMLDIAA